MAIIKNGSLTVVTGGAAQNLALGFIPTRFSMWNSTLLTATPVTGGVVGALWVPQMANGTAIVDKSYSVATAPAVNYSIQKILLAANGVTPYQTGDAALWTPTNITITGISKAAQAVVTAVNTLVIGDVVTFSGVVGMTQINTLRGKVVAAAGGNFTVDINTSAFTTYVSGGIANLISNNQYNVGTIGLTLGTSLMVNTNDIWMYEAVLDAPFTS
jgi:hypothetical protein